MAKLIVDSLTKIFGKNPNKALSLLSEGKTREDIYSKTKNLVAVNNVSFSVEQGQIAVIIGLSGSGKSTLLRCLNRLIEPEKGSITVDGTDVCELSHKDLRSFRQKKFGMVFQHFALFPHYSILKNVAYGLELMGIPLQERNRRAYEALECVGLQNRAEAMPKQLSGGMQQRVGLARALALDTEILLMDEAFSALDPLTRREMQSELLRLQHDLHKTIVFITHDLDEALNLGDKIILLKEGQIVQSGTPEDILESPADDYVAGFVSHVDKSKVLTVKSVMQPALAVSVLGADGPKSTLRKMNLLGVSSLFVVDSSHKLLGLVTEEDLLRLMAEKNRDISLVLQKDIITSHENELLASITGILASLPHPLPIVDDKHRLRGVIIRGMLLEALSNDVTSPEVDESKQEQKNDNAPLPDGETTAGMKEGTLTASAQSTTSANHPQQTDSLPTNKEKVTSDVQ